MEVPEREGQRGCSTALCRGACSDLSFFLAECVFQPTGAGRLHAQSTKPEDEEGAHSQARGEGER